MTGTEHGTKARNERAAKGETVSRDEAAARKERILAICRANWEYRGLDEASVRDMLAELSAHLEDAQAAGHATEDIVGSNVRAFAASWAQARAPLPRRALRMTAMACFVVGCVLLIAFLFRWSVRLDVQTEYVAYAAAFTAITVTVDLLRGGRTRFLAGTAAAVVAVVAAELLSRWLTGDGTLFTLPLWAVPCVLLPGLPYAVADIRARRRGEPDAG